MRPILAALIAGIVGLTCPAHAQDWPAKQITIVVPFGAGGSADLLARILAAHMQAKFGQTVVVENRAGAGGSIGTNYVAKAAPDGYTLLLGTVSSIAVNAALYAKLPFDVDKDLQPITQLVSSKYCSCVYVPKSMLATSASDRSTSERTSSTPL